MNLVAEKGFSDKYGARELRRAVNKMIGDKIAELIINDKKAFGSVITVNAAEGAITVE